jgi:hypothetical protein
VANDLSQDPLVFDTTATEVPCERIEAIKYVGNGTPLIEDSVTGHDLWSTDETCFDEIHLKIASGLIDVTISAGVLYIYLGSGPR